MILLPVRLIASLFFLAFCSFKPVRVVTLAVLVSSIMVVHHHIEEDPESLREFSDISEIDAGAGAKVLGFAGVVLDIFGKKLR